VAKCSGAGLPRQIIHGLDVDPQKAWIKLTIFVTGEIPHLGPIQSIQVTPRTIRTSKNFELYCWFPFHFRMEHWLHSMPRTLRTVGSVDYRQGTKLLPSFRVSSLLSLPLPHV
jgi:hypothetical protein